MTHAVKNNTNYRLIERTVFNHDYFDSQEYYDNVKREKYVRHNINISNRLIVKGVELDAMYQTGNSFRNNDYTLPCNRLNLSRFDRTDGLLSKISALEESDLQTEQDISNIINYLASPLVQDKRELMDLYEALKSNLRDARHYLNGLDLEPVISKSFTRQSKHP